MELAIDICTRLVDGKSLTAICKLARMPRVGTVYRWLSENSDFQKLYATAKLDQADTYGSMALDVANEPVADAVAVQRNRLRIDTLKWAAGVQRPGRYGAKVAIGGAEDLPPVQIDPVEGAKRIAFVLARAGHLLDANAPVKPVPPVPSERVAIERLAPYRQIMKRAAAELDFDVEESAAEMGRIGDPRRAMEPTEPGPGPLSARGRT